MSKKLITVLMVTYFLTSSVVFIPYYNWNYARENGFVKWFLFGEVVATVKAFAWPYFIFTGNEAVKRKSQLEIIQFNADERAIIQDFLSHTADTILSENDLSPFRSIMRSVSKRLGRAFSRVEADDFIDALVTNADYRVEFGAILLDSWDRKQYITTQRFNHLYERMEKYYPKGIARDRELIKAAAVNQDFLITAEGRRYPFGREVILLTNSSNTILKINTDKIAKVVREFTQ